MKKILGLFIIAAFVGLSVLVFTPTPSYALPNFAKKHEASCTLCHTVWPALNRFGEQYLMNGFQMPDTEDGGDVGKIKPDEHVALDSGGANPPLSVRMVIETTLTQDTKTEGATNDGRASLIEVKKVDIPFFLGGTLGKNLSYFVDGAPGTSGEQFWVGIHNIGGPGVANVRYGKINNADFDAWSNHRHDLSGSFADGVDTHIDAVGLQVYGRPGFGPLTYQVNADTHGRNKSNNLDLGLMLRADFDPIAISYHYGSGSTKDSFGSTNTSAYSLENSYTGESATVVAGGNTIETTSTSQVLAVRAIIPSVEVSAAYALNTTELKCSGCTGLKLEPSGLTLEAIYFTELFDIQARYSSLTYKDNTTNSYTTGGVTTTTADADYARSKISLKLDYHATTNSKIYAKYETNSYTTNALKAGLNSGYGDDYASIGVDWAF